MTLAVRLALDAAVCADLRHKVEAQRLEGRLFNTKGWVEEFQVRVSFMV